MCCLSEADLYAGLWAPPSIPSELPVTRGMSRRRIFMLSSAARHDRVNPIYQLKIRLAPPALE